MAHFARLGLDNIVEEVIVIDNIKTMTPQGVEDESIGIQYLKSIFGQGTIWKQTSYNGNFRKRYAGLQYTYSTALDAFIPPKPFPSWILNEETCDWIAPVPYPQDGGTYEWNEAVQNWE